MIVMTARIAVVTVIAVMVHTVVGMTHIAEVSRAVEMIPTTAVIHIAVGSLAVGMILIAVGIHGVVMIRIDVGIRAIGIVCIDVVILVAVVIRIVVIHIVVMIPAAEMIHIAEGIPVAVMIHTATGMAEMIGDMAAGMSLMKKGMIPGRIISWLIWIWMP